MKLPADCKIHPVFHVSQLKPVLGQGHQLSTLPQLVAESDGFVIQPEQLMETRYDEEGHLEALIHWKGLPTHERSWMRVRDVAREFPSFELEDKLKLIGGVLISPGAAM